MSAQQLISKPELHWNTPGILASMYEAMIEDRIVVYVVALAI
jgi:hypothetical protein